MGLLTVDGCQTEDLIIDRTPFNSDNADRIAITNAYDYNGSYVTRLFNKKEFVDYFIRKGYYLISEFDDLLDGNRDDYFWKGFIFTKSL